MFHFFYYPAASFSQKVLLCFHLIIHCGTKLTGNSMFNNRKAVLTGISPSSSHLPFRKDVENISVEKEDASAMSNNQEMDFIIMFQLTCCLLYQATFAPILCYLDVRHVIIVGSIFYQCRQLYPIIHYACTLQKVYR